jgi:hypothetical protein
MALIGSSLLHGWAPIARQTIAASVLVLAIPVLLHSAQLTSQV